MLGRVPSTERDLLVNVFLDSAEFSVCHIRLQVLAGVFSIQSTVALPFANKKAMRSSVVHFQFLNVCSYPVPKKTPKECEPIQVWNTMGGAAVPRYEGHRNRTAREACK